MQDFEASFRLQIVDGRAYIAGEMPGFFEFNRHTKVGRVPRCPAAHAHAAFASQAAAQAPLPAVQLFIIDVMKRHRLPDVDIVFSTAGA